MTQSRRVLRAAVGKVAGRLTDGVTGEPLVGGQVTVRGLPLGNLSDDTGSYHINNIPVGSQAVVVDYLGYEPQSKSLQVEPGLAASLDFVLAPTAIEAEEIIVEEEAVADLIHYVEQTPAPRFTKPALREVEVEEPDTSLMEEWHRSMRDGATVQAIEYPLQGTRVYYRRPAPRRRAVERASAPAVSRTGRPATAAASRTAAPISEALPRLNSAGSQPPLPNGPAAQATS
ncbi:MAG: carboxypeptidase-like regulatory domain-containing protein [Gemmatimonadetes bacterium]|nr:carboxypeptidase-like regulatory domain-containing protein [Gemmatimonadota bacterium]